jgi:uncharacterized SAM-binding protein YcdF (DUF218 family)
VNRFRILAAAAALSALVWLGVLASQIVKAGRHTTGGKADVAIVLGAAVYSRGPSPVFEERIKHGINLYRAGKVRTLLFTGGYGDSAELAESTVAKRYAVSRGVPPGSILTEMESRTTRENLLQARRLMRKNGFSKAMVVSDPLHLKRALKIAGDLGINASAAPTPTSRYRSWQAKSNFLLRELYFYNHYLVTGQ